MKAPNQGIHKSNRYFCLFVFNVVFLSLLAAGCGIKPEPYSQGQFVHLANADKTAIHEGVPPLSENGILSLNEAIVRALLFNFDNRLALSENVAADKERVQMAIAMLPDISASANLFDRSNENASSSMSYRTRQQSLEPSFSVPKDRQFGDLKFSWNILDAGMSYYSAVQQANRVLVTLERRRRVMNSIIKDVVSAYYRAKAAQIYLDRVRSLMLEAQRAQELYKRVERENVEPLPLVLEKQRSLINIVAQLRRIEGNLEQSRAQLAALCNIPLRDHFVLTTPPLPLPEMTHDIASLEMLALVNRPELREEHYQERADIARTKQEILRMFPMINILGSFNWDSNKYLVHNTWWEAGMQASFSLLRLAGTGPAGKRASEARQEVSQMRRLALSMATLIQVNLSRQQYDLSLKELEAAGKIRDIEKRLLKHVAAEATAEAGGKLALVQQKTQAFTAELLYDLSRVDANSALGNFYYSIGVGFADDLPVDASVREIADAVNNGLAVWAVGQVPVLPAPEPVADINPPKVFKDNLTVEQRHQSIKAVFSNLESSASTEGGQMVDPATPSPATSKTRVSAQPVATPDITPVPARSGKGSAPKRAEPAPAKINYDPMSTEGGRVIKP